MEDRLQEVTGTDEYQHPFFTESSIMSTPGFKNFVHNLGRPNLLISLGQLFVEYLAMVLVIWYNILHPSFWLYVPSMMIIGARMHGLFVLLHDAAHFKFCTKRWLNDAICTLTITFPLFINLYHWRANHFAHHRDTCGDEDPDWAILVKHPDYDLPMKVQKLLLSLSQHMFGIKYLVIIFSRKHSLMYKIKYVLSSFIDPLRVGSPPISGKYPEYYTKWQKVMLALGYSAVIGSIIYFGFLKYFVLFWLCPLFLWTHFITRLRTYTEHCGLEVTSAYKRSRTMYVSWWEIVFLGFDWNVNIHLDHHLFPSVTSYRLMKLHKAIKDVHPYSTHASITKDGVIGVIRECSQRGK